MNEVIISKNEARAMAEAMAKNVNAGIDNPLKLWGELKMLEEAVKHARDMIKDAAIEELAKYGAGTSINGVKFTKYNGKRFYKYDHNPEWVALKEKLTELERKMKMAYNANALMVDEDTGELIPHAKVTYSSETISVELP